jgi:hypothetical protein
VHGSSVIASLDPNPATTTPPVDGDPTIALSSVVAAGVPPPPSASGVDDDDDKTMTRYPSLVYCTFDLKRRII